jgi:hypothetical protein
MSIDINQKPSASKGTLALVSQGRFPFVVGIREEAIKAFGRRRPLRRQDEVNIRRDVAYDVVPRAFAGAQSMD